jgi:hypothetical protein
VADRRRGRCGVKVLTGPSRCFAFALLSQLPRDTGE